MILIYTALAVVLLVPALCGITLMIKTGQVAAVCHWYAKSVVFFLVDLPVTVIGFLMVALALPFRIEHPETDAAFTDPEQKPGTHRLVTLPGWARPWDNIFDGAWGDKRGWWNSHCPGRDCRSFLSMWWWLAVRNPANYWSRVVAGCDVSLCDITLVAGSPVVDEHNPGWQLLCATERDTGKKFHYFGFVFFPYEDKTHYIFGRYGWKINMAHNGTDRDDRIQDRIKASVFRSTLWKAI